MTAPGHNTLITCREEQEGTMPNQHDLWRDGSPEAPHSHVPKKCVYPHHISLALISYMILSRFINWRTHTKHADVYAHIHIQTYNKCTHAQANNTYKHTHVLQIPKNKLKQAHVKPTTKKHSTSNIIKAVFVPNIDRGKVFCACMCTRHDGVTRT